MADLKLEKVMIDNEEKLIFDTAYGEIELQEDKLVSFSDGLIGFSNCTVFGLDTHPAAKNSPILILQCVNDPSVSFAVVDSSSIDFEYSDSDKADALKSANILAKDAIILFILRASDVAGDKTITANVKAPIIIDTAHKVAKQVILNNKDLTTTYEI